MSDHSNEQHSSEPYRSQQGAAVTAEQMRGVLGPVVGAGREFLAGRVDAHGMTGVMIDAAHDYRRGASVAPETPPTGSDVSEYGELRAALAEVHNCGSGFREGRCEADCVARTMAEIVGEFGDLAPAAS